MGSMIIKVLCVCVTICALSSGIESTDPTPKPWPLQFHALLYQNVSGSLAVINLWYDWPNGRNFNIIRSQLSSELYDLEWTNGTSFFYDKDQKTCRVVSFDVGILRPNWLSKAKYVGVQEIDGFRCNVWEKEDFITYFEDIVTQRPVAWLFYTGRFIHVMTFEVGKVLSDDDWQAPSYCFPEEQAGSVSSLYVRSIHACYRWLHSISHALPFSRSPLPLYNAVA